jgi:hypothetical protein
MAQTPSASSQQAARSFAVSCYQPRSVLAGVKTTQPVVTGCWWVALVTFWITRVLVCGG